MVMGQGHLARIAALEDALFQKDEDSGAKERHDSSFSL